MPDATVQLMATVRDAAGNVLTGRAISWTSSDGGIVTVNSSGLVAAVGAGTATITAESEGKQATARVTVLQASVASVSLSPTALSLAVGEARQIDATPLDAGGKALTGRTVTWTSSDQTIATVSATGVVTGIGVGSATVTAESEGKRASATVTVRDVPVAVVQIIPGTSASLYTGGSLQLTAITRDSQGNLLSGRVVSWASSNQAAIAITAIGLVSAVTFGSSFITATSEGVSSSIVVNVLHDPIVFVHGFQSSGAIWTTMIDRLKVDGWTDSPLVTWTYDSNLSNVTIAQILQAKVDSLLSETGARKVDIITHSMGGLSARYFSKSLGGSDKIDAFVSLATPNHGTTTANLCGVQPCLEMRTGSAFLIALNADDETPGSPRYATWWTPCDQVTTPPASVILAGATNTQTACLQHSDLYRDATVYAQVRDWVK